jgi:hypothetical protein
MAFPYLQAAALLYGAFRYFFKPAPKKAGYKGGSIEVSATANAPVPLVYGNCEVTGNIIYKEDTTSATNNLAVGLCEGQIEGIDSVRINGVNIPVAPDTYQGCSYTPYYGTAAQTTDARFTTSTMYVTCYENNYVDEGDDTVQDWSSTKRLYIEDDNGDNKSKYMFLKFSIAALNLTASSDITSAYLRLYKNSTSLTSNHTVYVYEMADDSWTESTVKWSNKPAFGDQITTVSGSLFNGTQEYYDINISQWVKDTFDYDSSKIVGIGISVVNSSTGVAQAVFTSRDAAGAPQVLIKYAPKELTAFAHTAYVALTVVDSELFKGHINDIKVTVRGKLIYDGDASPNYSRTPAWVVYDLLTSARYGADIPTSLINASSFTAVASYNDTSVTTDEGTSEPRHRCDVVFDDKDTVADRINAVLASFGGYLYTLDGKINIGVDCSASSSHTFTMDNIVAGSFNFWMIDKSEAPNDVSVMYYDAANDFKASYVNVKDQTLIDSYGRNFEEIQLTCINRYSQASRMAKYYLNKTIYSTYGCSFKVSINHCNVAPGDVCEITHTVPGWTAKDFRIISVVEDSNDELEITCEEYDSDLYSDEGLPYTPPEGSTLPNPNELPPIVTGLTLTESHAQGDDGTYIPQIKVDWTVPDYQFPLQYIVWYKLTADADYIYWELSTDNLAYINTDGAGQYDVVVQTVNQLSGIKTDFGTSPSDTITLAGKTDPPSDVEFNDINCTFYQEVYLEWLPVTDTDLAFYEVRTDTNWGNSTNLVYQGKGTAYIMANPALTTYTFYIKARDLSDNYSDTADSIELTKADPVLGAITIDFSGRDCFLTWEHTEDKDFVKYKVEVYSDSARETLIRTENIASPPYIYTYENNASDNSGTAIRHPYFTIYKLTTLAQEDSQNADDANEAPGAPTGLTLTPGQGKLFVSWTAPAGSDIIGYNVYAKTSSPADTLIAFVNATNYTFDPESENTYYVTVAAVDPFGEGTKCSEETQTTNPYALTNYSLDVPMTRGINYTVDTGALFWTTGKLWYEGTEYTIAAEETGTAHAFIYWDKDSPTVFQHSDTAPALDDDVWLMAYFDGTDVYSAFAQKIIHGGLIQADSIEASKLSVDSLSAITANMGTVTSGTMQTAASGKRIVVSGTNNNLSLYKANGNEIIRIDDEIGDFAGGDAYVASAGIAIYNDLQEPTYSYRTFLTGNGLYAINGSLDEFSRGIYMTSGDIYFFRQTADDTLLGHASKYISIRSENGVSSTMIFTLPNIGANANFIMSEGDQSIDGVKTFEDFPVTPSAAPTTDYQVANKKYVDDNAGGSTSPGGSDSYVQYNNGGAFGGDDGMVYDDTNERLTVTCILAGGQNSFATQSADTGFIDGLLLTSNGDLGAGELGASVAFSKNNSVTRHAAIAAKQITTDSDQVGLSIFTHPSGTGSDPMVEAIEISHTGHITLKNSATVFKEIHVPFNQFKLRGTSDPALGKIASNGASVGVYVYLFEYGGTDEIFGAIVLPQDYKAAATLYPHIHRMLDVAPDATTDDFRIGMEYTWCEEDGTMSATTSNELEITVGADSNTKLIRSELTSISGSGHAAGSTLLFRLYREPVVTGVDTESGVYITSLDFEYESDKLGSNATTV